MMVGKSFKVGDPVVYRTTKHTASPGPRARDIDPAPLGDLYLYKVDKYWTVNAIHEDGKLELRTRRGKIHVIEPDHENLRHATLLERWFKADRFPKLQPPESP